MKLSEIIVNYRKRMHISQREFARKCDLSNSYISFIENESNPRTGKPIKPTLEQYKKIADGMNITMHHLFEILDEDSLVDFSASEKSPSFSESLQILDPLPQDETQLLEAWRKADDSIKSAVRKLLDIPDGSKII